MRDWDDSSPEAGPPVVSASFPASLQRVCPRKAGTCFDLDSQNGNTHPGAGRWARAALPAASGTPGQLSWSGQTLRNLFCWLIAGCCWIHFLAGEMEMIRKIVLSHHIAVFLLQMQRKIKGFTVQRAMAAYGNLANKQSGKLQLLTIFFNIQRFNFLCP